MFCSFYAEVDISETGHVRGRSIAILKKWENCYESTYMESKNVFTENLLSTAVDFSISENATFWKRQ